MSMGNYLTLGTVRTSGMKGRVPIGIDHLTVVPENTDRGPESDAEEGQ